MLRDQQYEIVPIESIEPNPRNPHRGDRERIAQSIAANGFYGAVLVQKSSRTIIAGEHRWRELSEAGETDIPVILLDVDDERAEAILLADNRTSQFATDDPAMLLDLLTSMPETNLDAVGYSTSDVEKLLALVSPPPPQEFPVADPSSFDLPNQCPSCGFEW